MSGDLALDSPEISPVNGPRRSKSGLSLKGSDLRHSISQQRHCPEHKLDGLLGESSLRRGVASVLLHHIFEAAMNLVIAINIVVVVWETDVKAEIGRGTDLQNTSAWLKRVGVGCLGVYVVEMAMRLFVWRLKFFRQSMNTFDLLVVAVDALTLVLESAIGDMPSASVLRIVRLVKLSRAMRAFGSIKELYIIVSGLMAAFKAIFFGSIVVGVLLIFWSVLAVELLQPLVKDLAARGFYAECERCGVAFDTVFSSTLTFIQQIVAGDSWGQISVPLIEHHPETLVILVLALVSVNCGVMNLLLSAIVNSANERREADKEHKLKTKNKEFHVAKEELRQLCAQMDADNSGTLTCAELLEGYKENHAFFDIMHMLDVDPDDMSLIFKALDKDRSGSVTYDEFCEQLHKMKVQESGSLLMFIKCHIQDVEQKVSDELNLLNDEMKILRDIDAKFESLLQSSSPALPDVQVAEPKATAAGSLAVAIRSAEAHAKELCRHARRLAEVQVPSLTDLPAELPEDVRFLVEDTTQLVWPSTSRGADLPSWPRRNPAPRSTGNALPLAPPRVAAASR